ncbi:MAG: MBL fold metallo-hydrolase [Phyllobacteriaceae bacterium]|nr:MBL fold metallo-hydrolase [Phyllobacteriaceae bacterium]
MKGQQVVPRDLAISVLKPRLTKPQSKDIVALRVVVEGMKGGKPVKRVIVTHLHPDHVGLAGWIVERFGCRRRGRRA